MKRISANTNAAGMVAAALIAACSAAPAHADPTSCESPTPAMAEFCKGIKDLQDLRTTTPAPATTPSSSSGGLVEWAGDHVLFLLIAAVVVVIAIVSLKESAKEQKGRKTAATEADLARGRQIALDAGLSPVEQSPEDLRRYATFGWAVPHVPGTALGFLVDRDGSTDRVNAAWAEACELARLGHWDEGGKFTPAAAVVSANGYADGTGDLELSVNTRDYTVGEAQLNKVLGHLVRTARVETATDFTRDAARDWHVTRLSMMPAAQQVAAAAPEQEAPAPDPTEQWEW